MRARLLVLLVVVVATLAVPVGAASAQAASDGCNNFNSPTNDGLAVSGGVSGSEFFEGEVLTVSADLPSTSGNPTSINLSVNFVPVGSDDFPGSVSYTVPADGVYTVVGWIVGGGNATLSVSCEPNAPVSVDSDNDGVLDADDLCADTVLPDTPTVKLKKNRYAAQADGTFVTGTAKKSKKTATVYTLADTAGCSASQIVELQGLGKGHTKFGLSKGELKKFIASV